MPRNSRLRLALVIVILVLSVGLSVERAYSSGVYSISGQWVSFTKLVGMEIGNVTSPDGTDSMRFAVDDHTGQINFGYVFEEPISLTSGYLAFWIRIKNIADEHYYFLILDDDQGRRRAFWDLVTSFDLQPMTWARLVFDPSTYWWGDEDFDPARVARARFVFSAGASRYSEVVWLSGLSSFEPEPPANQVNEDRRLPLIWGIVLTISLALIAGFVTVELCGLPRTDNAFVMAPVHALIGLSSILLVSLLLALSRLDYFTVTGSMVSLVAFLLLLVRRRVKRAFRSWSFRSLRNASILMPMILFGFSLVRFTSLALSFGWPPLFDPQTHGMYVSLILQNNKIPSSTYPVGNLSLSPLQYPMGFHVLGALISTITHIYPGEAILAILISIMIFLPSLLFTTIYISTSSLGLSLIAYLLAYFLPGGEQPLWRPSHNLLLGNFQSGLCPNLLGNALFLTLFPLALSLEKNKEVGLKTLTTYALLLVSLAVVYYPLLPYALLPFLLVTLKRRMTSSGVSVRKISEAVIVLAILAASYLYLNSHGAEIIEANNISVSLNYVAYMRYPLFDPASPYLIYTATIFSALPLSLYLYFDKKATKVAIMFWVLFFPLMISQQESIFTDFLWFTRPARALILLVVTSYIVILLSASKVYNSRIRNSLKLNSVGSGILFKTVRVQVLLGVVLVFTPSMIAHLSYSYPPHLKDELPHGNDLAAMEWLFENAESTDLILNFPVSTFWLPSLKAMNVINDREILRHLYLFESINGTWLANRTMECNLIVSRPWDYELVKEIACSYNLKYIYIGEGNPRASQWARGVRYTPLLSPILLSQGQRLAMYMLNPYLEVVYRAGNAVVFRVKQD